MTKYIEENVMVSLITFITQMLLFIIQELNTTVLDFNV